VKAVHVLVWVDALEHDALVNVVRQRQLHQYAVNLRVRVEVADEGEKLILRQRCRKVVIQ